MDQDPTARYSLSEQHSHDFWLADQALATKHRFPKQQLDVVKEEKFNALLKKREELEQERHQLLRLARSYQGDHKQKHADSSSSSPSSHSKDASEAKSSQETKEAEHPTAPPKPTAEQVQEQLQKNQSEQNALIAELR